MVDTNKPYIGQLVSVGTSGTGLPGRCCIVVATGRPPVVLLLTGGRVGRGRIGEGVGLSVALLVGENGAGVGFLEGAVVRYTTINSGTNGASSAESRFNV